MLRIRKKGKYKCNEVNSYKMKYILIDCRCLLNSYFHNSQVELIRRLTNELPHVLI